VCHKSCIIFAARNLTSEEVRGRDVIEVGSRDVNGSLRSIIESWGADRYMGVDIEKGVGVDVVCKAEDLVDKFGEDSFDLVISTEALEHIRNWQGAISNIKRVCKKGGIVLLTTRSEGYGYHGYPSDFWRFSMGDMKQIFSDFEMLTLEKDPEAPGVFVKVRKPEKFAEANLSSFGLYSILQKKRVVSIDNDFGESLGYGIVMVREKAKNILFSIARRLMKRAYPEQYFG
jgi:SAM-dependent methyltransferase